MPYIIGGMAAAQGLGALIGSIDPGRDIDERRLKAAYMQNPMAAGGTAATQGAQAAGAISSQLTPADQAQAMRAQQERYLEQLRASAYGERSLAREQMAREQQRIQQAIGGEAASARGRYGQLAARRQAPMESSLIGARMVAPTEALAAQERQRAMAAYQQAMGAQAGLDTERLRTAREEAALLGEQAKLDWGRLGLQDMQQAIGYTQGKAGV
jgi:hypothetical protein